MTTRAGPATPVSSSMRAARQTQTRCFPRQNTVQLNITDIIGRWWCGLGITSASEFCPLCDQSCERHGASRRFFARPHASAEPAASAVPLTDWAVTPGYSVRRSSNETDEPFTSSTNWSAAIADSNPVSGNQREASPAQFSTTTNPASKRTTRAIRNH